MHMSIKAICILICFYGFFKENRPSEPYLTDYLKGPWQNLTEAQINQEVYPIWTYAYLAFLILVFLATDLLRYKPTLVFEGLGYIGTWALLIWAKGVFAMQMMEILYAVATSTEVAYFTYLYAIVPEESYKKVTSYVRAALLFGRFSSGLTSQLLVSYNVLNYAQLNYISFASVLVTFLIACWLPTPEFSIYFHNKDDQLKTAVESESRARQIKSKIKEVGLKIWDHLKVFQDSQMLKWSIWWALATAINLQIGNYIQPLWIQTSRNLNMSSNATHYNGAVEATQTLLGCLSAFGIGYIHVPWEYFGELILFAISGVNGGVLLVMGLINSLELDYVCYVVIKVTYQAMITIISYQVAKNIPKDSYCLIFGINTFAALLFQTIVTVIFMEKSGLEFSPQSLFILLGGFYFCLSGAFLIIGLKNIWDAHRRKVSVSEYSPFIEIASPSDDQPPDK